jgi:hypothetical protein
MVGTTTSSIITQGNAITINSGVVHSSTKSNAYFSRTATLASALNLDINLTVNNIIGSDITQPTLSTFTLTPSNGLTKSYLIRFNMKYATNALLNHALDFAFVSVGAQTINGVAVVNNAQFGSGGSLFSSTWAGQESGSGEIEYIITTSVPITFKVRIIGQTNTPTIGSTTSNRFPSLTIQEL